MGIVQNGAVYIQEVKLTGADRFPQSLYLTGAHLPPEQAAPRTGSLPTPPGLLVDPVQIKSQVE